LDILLAPPVRPPAGGDGERAMPLNDNQRKFIALYRSTTPRNATRAYEAVYKSRGKAASDNAARLIGLDSIRAEIDRLDAEELRDLGITPARVLREIARLGFSDVRQLYDASGALKAPHELDEDLAAAVSAVEVVTYVKEDTGEALLARTHKIRLWNKAENLKLLAQYLKLMTETVTVEHTGEVLHTWQERLTTAHTSLEERRNGHAHAP
jgi:phage terminase small subunit